MNIDFLFSSATNWVLIVKSDWFRLIELSKYYNFGVAFYMSHTALFLDMQNQEGNQKKSQKLIEFITVRCTLRKWLKHYDILEFQVFIALRVWKTDGTKKMT